MGLVVVLVMVCGSCASRPESPAAHGRQADAQHVPTELLRRSTPIVWLFAGDSITAGVVHTRGYRDYTQHFRERLYELGRSDDVVLNTAKSGMWVENLLEQVDDRVLRWHPDVVFLMFGANDATAGREGIARFSEQYANLIKKCKASGIDVFVQTTVPMAPLDPALVQALEASGDARRAQAAVQNLERRLEFLGPYAEATRKVAQESAVPVIDHWNVWQRAGEYRGQLLDGEIHPNEYGHRLLAQTVLRDLGIWDDQSWVCRICAFVPTRQ
jgi:acyl-CoA thioesterase I